MKCTPVIWTVSDVWSKFNQIDRDPSYQRNAGVWDLTKKRNLIDSILNGYDLPKIFLHEYAIKGPTHWGIVDGKQRLTTIGEFLENQFELSSMFAYFGDLKFADDEEPAAGQYFKDLSPAAKAIVLDYKLSMTLIETDRPGDIESMFIRLNDGVKLNDAEYRQGLGGMIIELISSLESHSFFADKVPLKNDRYQYKELSCRLLFLEHSLRNKDPLPSIQKRALDEFVIKNKLIDVSKSDALFKATQKNLNFMNDCFSPKSNELSASTVQLYYLWLRELKEKYVVKNSQAAIREFIEQFKYRRMTDSKLPVEVQQLDLQRFTWLSGQQTNKNDSMRERMNILTRQFLIQYPDTAAFDSKRNYSDEEKYIIWFLSDRKCTHCGIELPDYREAHADHIVAHSNGGQTTIENGQTLCATHNTNKSNKWV